MPTPLSKDPRPDAGEDKGAPNRAGRYAGCGCVFVPAGLFLLAGTGGLLLGEASLPDGSVGWEPGRGLKILIALGAAALCVWIGALWVQGRPRTGSARTLVLPSTILFAGAAEYGMMEGIGPAAIVAALVSGLAVALIAGAFVRDGKSA